MNERALWRELGQELRVDSIRASAAAGSGHPTSAMSAADLMAVLVSKYFLYDFDHPEDPSNDHLVFSKGHASPLLYSIYSAVGAITDDELMSFRKFGSRLEGHPTPALPWVDAATGSLGQGLPIGVGLALSGRYLDRLGYRVWVLIGDGEMAEGSMWEAFEHAAYARLSNLIAIIDVNRLGQAGETRHGWDTAAYSSRLRAFGWHAIEIDGHDVDAIDRAYAEALSGTERPTAIVARTEKGHGVASVANQNGMHGKPLAHPDAAIEELGGRRNQRIWPPAPRGGTAHHFAGSGELALPRYTLGDSVSVRRAFGDALVAIGRANGKVVALDGDVRNSTYSERFAAELPERFFELFIAEQQMIAAAIGLQARGWIPFVSTFGAFLTRAHDFLRMGTISRASLKVVGTHAGVSIGQDGPSQMALGDMAMFRALHGATVLYPCDANQAAALTALMVAQEGISYLRVTRDERRVIYGPDERFTIGGSRLVRASKQDAVTLVAAGITVHEALLAADALAHEGIAARVVDCYSVKPIDAATLRAAARATDGRLVTVEDHRAEGGLGDAVLEAFASTDVRPRVVKLGVRAMPGSGRSEELIDAMGIGARWIAQAARELVLGPRAAKGKAA